MYIHLVNTEDRERRDRGLGDQRRKSSLLHPLPSTDGRALPRKQRRAKGDAGEPQLSWKHGDLTNLSLLIT